MSKRSINKGSEKFLASRTRIKNKERKLTKRIKNFKPETQDKIKKVCRIGRKKEGFQNEAFKFMPRKNKSNAQNIPSSK